VLLGLLVLLLAIMAKPITNQTRKNKAAAAATKSLALQADEPQLR
jgi:hypothetical protein